MIVHHNRRSLFMTGNNSLELLTLRGKSSLPRPTVTPNQGNPPPETDGDEDECPAFGYLRGVRDRAPSLELRFSDGNAQAFPYTLLTTAVYDPSRGVLCKFVGDLVYYVLIEGSNLNVAVKQGMSLYSRG